MAINITAPELRELKPRIVVLGVGGAGGNAINNMIDADIQGVEFVAANTDAQDLKKNKADCKIQLGANLTRGLGAGSKADIGQAAADETMNEIINLLQGANMVFVTAGMGGGTGTGAAPVIAKAAKDLNILTVGVVTKPFMYEGPGRIRVAEAGLENLLKVVDTSIIIPNQNLFKIADEKTPLVHAFKMADNVLMHGVRGITDLIVKPGLMNLDFADIETIMSGMGKAMMGTGEADGENRAVIASDAAINNPLIDDYTLKGAKGLLVNITGGNDITLFEVDEAANKIRAEVDPGADILIGNTIDETMTGKVRVSIVVTGLGGEVVKNKPTLSVVQSRNGYASQNLFNTGTSNVPHKNNYAAYMSNQPYAPPVASKTSMSATQNVHVSGANALDIGSINQASDNVTPDIKTNYREIQENIKVEDPIVEDFLSDKQNFDTNQNDITEAHSSNYEENLRPSPDEKNFVTPQLFTGDHEIKEEETISQYANIDTDLSNLDFDDKDDLEIPAFLRRQTN
ncbi:MAG: cell division protein FtsZ [Candidatus Pelagibacter sp.]|nr:cell division protein FtsZ [Candidatus Pelagibacter sp.]OUV87819.1 MAG: cell division protein FtsZ [Pelagibacteraceae bacterium TMED136]|tara:strand:+ start:677 stop:2218 length:1542 start_codon:yes stop_codon:yes gene_type:complete